MSTTVVSASGSADHTNAAEQRHLWRLEARARRAARRVGWVARKPRRLAGTLDNRGGFTLIDPRTNRILYGERCELSAHDVIAICTAVVHG